MSLQDLLERRSTIDAHWCDFASSGTLRKSANLQQSISSSWQRSAAYLDAQQACAPADDSQVIAHRWQHSVLKDATAREGQVMSQLVNDGRLVAAIADTSGRLLWTSSSNYMRQRAESVNFMAGARWDEKSAGTNAVGLALTERRAVTVFSSEHYLSSVHDWVCYAAPIIHPKTNDCVGILDMSTTWKRHSPLGQAAVIGMAHSIAHSLPDIQPKAELELYALGQPRAMYQGRALQLSLRQTEILCLLALNPEGLTLAQFHGVLYGDAPVSLSTLKSELSHLRRLIGSNIGSRPYRLLTPIWADFIEIWKLLQCQQTDEALSLYRGPLLAQSASPELEEWRCCIDAIMNKSLRNCKDSQLLIKKLNGHTEGSEMVRDRLQEILATVRH